MTDASEPVSAIQHTTATTLRGHICSVVAAFMARFAEDVLMRDRDRRRADAMRTTLDRIKAVAEASDPPRPTS